ncbi:hypothetical protein DRJ25_04845 [Candidatus Woesearchaeota archaeon]|nr:MAG: hypothetical protein DRJ25_04845 [Candidatus Woesearchaeota archaeon]
MFNKRNKKSSIGLAVKPLVGLVLAAILIVMTFAFFGKLYGLFLGGKDDSGTIERYQDLGEKIEELLASKKSFETETLAYYIDGDYVIVGFDNVWDNTLEVDEKGWGEREWTKPLICGNSACLCIFKKSSLENEIACKAYSGNIAFAGIFDEDSNLGLKKQLNYDSKVSYLTSKYSYSYLFLYEMDPVSLYVEKYVNEDGSINILLSSSAKVAEDRQMDISAIIKKEVDEELARLGKDIGQCYADKEGCENREFFPQVSGISGYEIIGWLDSEESGAGQPAVGIDSWDKVIQWKAPETVKEQPYYMEYKKVSQGTPYILITETLS